MIEIKRYKNAKTTNSGIKSGLTLMRMKWPQKSDSTSQKHSKSSKYNKKESRESRERASCYIAIRRWANNIPIYLRKI